MTLYKKIQKALTDLINGGSDSAAIYQLEQEIGNAHMTALLKIKEYRNDGF